MLGCALVGHHHVHYTRNQRSSHNLPSIRSQYCQAQLRLHKHPSPGPVSRPTNPYLAPIRPIPEPNTNMRQTLPPSSAHRHCAEMHGRRPAGRHGPNSRATRAGPYEALGRFALDGQPGGHVGVRVGEGQGEREGAVGAHDGGGGE